MNNPNGSDGTPILNTGMGDYCMVTLGLTTDPRGHSGYSYPPVRGTLTTGSTARCEYDTTFSVPSVSEVNDSALRSAMQSGETIYAFAYTMWMENCTGSATGRCKARYGEGAIIPPSGAFESNYCSASVPIKINDPNRSPTAYLDPVAPTDLPEFTTGSQSIGTAIPQGTPVQLNGRGTDPDNDPISVYEWRIDGNSCTSGGTVVSTQNFSKSDLSVGSHTIYFSVIDSKGARSTNCPSVTLTIVENSCTPTNPGCAANTCTGQTCWDGCDNIPGTKTGTSCSGSCTPTNPGCAANTCTGQTCWDGCDNIPGTKTSCSASCGTAHTATLSCGDFVNCLGGRTICSSGTDTGYAGTEPSGQPTLALYNGSTWVGWDWTCSGSPRCAACLPGYTWNGSNCTAACTVTSWSPDPSTVCSGQSFTQTSNCGTTRTNTGTKSCTCTPTNPGCAANTCTGQTCWDGCNNVPGTNTCGGEDITLTVIKAGTVPGSVSSNPAGISSCTTVCTATYAQDTPVTLTASHGSNVVVEWSECDAPSGDFCTVTMNASRSVTATYTCPAGFAWNSAQNGCVPTANMRTLTVYKEGTGSGVVKGLNIDCGSTCVAGYPEGEIVTLTSAPSGTSEFVGWGGACSGTQTTCTVTMDTDKTVTATYTCKPGYSWDPVAQQCTTSYCGSATGGTYETFPADNTLCTSGATPQNKQQGSTTFLWECVGADNTSTCSAMKQQGGGR